MSVPSYWREIPQRYRYEAARCQQSQKVYFPPRLVCPLSGGREFEKVQLPTTGTVSTFTIIRVPPKPFADSVPYAIGLVALDNGPTVMAQIVDCELDEIQIGMPVRIEFRRIRDEGEDGIICYGYKFVPA